MEVVEFINFEGEDKMKVIELICDKDIFMRYEDVRRGGTVNMLSPKVQKFANITVEQHSNIINNYVAYKELYLSDK
jgi:hypothetical protein